MNDCAAPIVCGPLDPAERLASKDVLSETHARREEVFVALAGARSRSNLEAWGRTHALKERIAALEGERARLLLALETEERQLARIEAAADEVARLILVEETRIAWTFSIREAQRPLSVREWASMLAAVRSA